MARTIQDARQVALRNFLNKLANATDYAGTTDNKPANTTELDNLLLSLNTELTPPLDLSASSTPDLTVSVGSGIVTNADTGVNRSLPHIGDLLPSFTSGTITFPSTSGGTVTISPGTNSTLTVASGNFIKVLIYLDALGNLNILPGVEDAVEANATVLPAPNDTLPIGYVVLQNVAGTIQNITQSNIYQFATGGGASGGGGGNGILEPAPGYRALEVDDFTTLPTSSDSKVDTTNTTAKFDIANGLYEIKCDKSLTCTTTGTSYTLSANPSFTVAVGDIIWDGGQNTFRRIATVTTQTTGTLDVAFPTDIAGTSVMVSQAVVSKDLVNLGDATQKTRPRDFFSGNISTILVDYKDSLAVGDSVPDFVDAANVVVSASSVDSVNATSFPTSDQFNTIFTRPQAPAQINNYPLTITATGGIQERLFQIFFCNPNNVNVTTQANLIGYSTSFYDEPTINNGGVLDSAFAMTDGSQTPVNAVNPTVVNGKTQMQLNFSYVANVNSGRTKGQLEVFVDGKVVPRFVSGAHGTGELYYTEITDSNGVYNTIEFNADLSTATLSIEVFKSEGVVDTNNANSTKISGISGIVVGSATDVTNGIASYSSIQDAINNAQSGDKITILKGTYVENITINKEVFINGMGRQTVIQGTVDFNSGFNFSMFKDLKVDGAITVNSNGNFIHSVFISPTGSITDLGSANSIIAIQE